MERVLNPRKSEIQSTSGQAAAPTPCNTSMLSIFAWAARCPCTFGALFAAESSPRSRCNECSARLADSRHMRCIACAHNTHLEQIDVSDAALLQQSANGGQGAAEALRARPRL